MNININENGRWFIFYFDTKRKLLYFRLWWRLPCFILDWGIGKKISIEF